MELLIQLTVMLLTNLSAQCYVAYTYTHTLPHTHSTHTLSHTLLPYTHTPPHTMQCMGEREMYSDRRNNNSHFA